MREIEDFLIGCPYTLTEDDRQSIILASPDVKNKDHWDNKCLDGFKGRFRSYMLLQQNYRCVYCRLELHPNEVTPEIEHIVPKSLKPNWMYEPFNLCLSCKLCNTIKGHKKETLVNEKVEDIPYDSGSYKMIHPYLDKYSENIELVGNVLYRGVTDKGRYTIRLCELNRYRLAAVRAMEQIKSEVSSERKTLLLLAEHGNDALVDNMNALLEEIRNRINVFKQENEI